MLARRISAASAVALVEFIGHAYAVLAPVLLLLYIDQWMYILAVLLALEVVHRLLRRRFREETTWLDRKLRWPITFVWALVTAAVIFGVLVGITDIDLGPSK